MTGCQICCNWSRSSWV